MQHHDATPRHDDATQRHDTMPRRDDATQRHDTTPRCNDVTQRHDAMPRHDDVTQRHDAMPRRDDATQRSSTPTQRDAAPGQGGGHRAGGLRRLRDEPSRLAVRPPAGEALPLPEERPPAADRSLRVSGRQPPLALLLDPAQPGAAGRAHPPVRRLRRLPVPESLPEPPGWLRGGPRPAPPPRPHLRRRQRALHHRHRGGVRRHRQAEAAGVPALAEAARRLLPHARRRRGGRQERLLRRRRGLAHQRPDARALRRDGRVDREVPELGGRHRRRAGHGGPRRVHLLRRGRLGHPQEGTSAGPPELAALGDRPADALRGRLPGSLQQAGGWVLLLLASWPPAPAPPCPPRRGRRGAQHVALDVRPVGAAGIHPAVLPVPGRRAARQAGQIPGFLPHLLLPERAGHRPAFRQRRPPPRGGPGRPREPPGHAPRLQHRSGEGGESGDAFLAAARAQRGVRVGGPAAPPRTVPSPARGGCRDAADGQSEVLRVLAIPKSGPAPWLPAPSRREPRWLGTGGGTRDAGRAFWHQ
ncbi:protein farnesyltransferase subunit beta isoform X3 [Opisthocomus hoazin]|uniref:protein farnesyltransferase subunit beta isoform X3 n=1 Tax=Opisthocomus hoazin TaxID=30419 RepID=UPI003F53B2B6